MGEIINDPLSMPLLNNFTSVIGFTRLSFPGTRQTGVKVLLPMLALWAVKEVDLCTMTHKSLRAI